MFYQLYEWQRPHLALWLEAFRMAGLAGPWQHFARAHGELLTRTARAAEVPDATLEDAVAGDARGPILHEVVDRRPFHRLVRFRRARSGKARTLLLAPHSGYATAVLSQLIHALLRQGEVLVTDWIDARLIPEAEGRFDLAEQIAIAASVFRRHGPRLQVVALSQAGLAALVATRRLAREAPARVPASLALIGAPSAPEQAPPPLQRLLTATPRAALEGQLLSTVASRYPGTGRRVFPGIFQLFAYAAASPALYLDTHLGLLAELLVEVRQGYARQHADLHRLIDVPAELFLDTLDHVRRPIFAATEPPPARTRLLTVEAGADGLVGAGQTHAAHELLAGADGADRQTLTIPGAQHHDLFVGPRFAAELAPALAAFAAAGGSRVSFRPG